MQPGALRSLLTLGLILLAIQMPAATYAAPPDYEITVNSIIASGLVHPVQVTHAGDGSDRLFVVEQPGRIRVIKTGALLTTPYLDITALTDDVGEQGLLGVAFHPQYASNGYFYVNYTRATDGATRIIRYTASPPSSDTASPASALEILTVSQPFANHNGGQVAFGPDGMLYVGMGDGGSGGDPLEAAQNIESLLGKMLRLNVDAATPYAIPSSNPYVGKPGRDEIWALGLRNPWRFSFDRANGDLYIGDVGQNAWEEISYQKAGTPGAVNFGWDCKEGLVTYEWDSACAAAILTDPIAVYGRAEGQSVTGGFVYRGHSYPALSGRYFFADYVTGRIWSLDAANHAAGAVLELDTALNISAFGEDESGELYVVDRGGTVRRLADVNGPSLPPDLSPSRKSASTLTADPGETVTYTISLINLGRAVPGAAVLTDTVPSGLAYVQGTLSATTGTASAANAPNLTWTGMINANAVITITYQARVEAGASGSLVNHALLTHPELGTIGLATALHVPRSALMPTLQDLLLPGSQPSAITDTIRPAIDCDTCHSAPIYDAWRGTLMSQAARDPLLYAAMATANADAGGAGAGVAGDYCLRCHTPQAWLAGRSHPADGSALTAADVADGVSCALCHRLVDPQPTGSEAATIDVTVRAALTTPVPSGYVGSATLIVDPADNRRGPFNFDPALPYHTAYQTDFLGQTSAAATRARVCGTCHDVDNPLLAWDSGRGQYWPSAMDTAPVVAEGALFPIETTYSEWAASAYPVGVAAPRFAGATPGGVVSACQDCHMARTTGTAADAAFTPVYRDCGVNGCLPGHAMAGGNAWMPVLLQDPAWRLSAAGDAAALNTTARQAASMLTRAATLTMTVTEEPSGPVATVRVINETGHKLPTGYPEGRQMWPNVRAYDAEGALVYEIGRYDPLSRRLIREAGTQVYEAKQGLTPELAALLGLPEGESFHFILNNTTVKDNRIPPRGYTQAAWDQPGLRPVGASYADGQHWDDVAYGLPQSTARVIARLYYQTASTEYIEFLKATGGVDGETLQALWSRNPSPPVLMAVAFHNPWRLWMPVIARDG